MSKAESGTTLSLPARVDAGAAAQLYRDWSSRAAGVDAIDFSAVRQIDSAGVALVLALRRLRGRAFTLIAVPDRYRQLCLAHRVALGGD